MILYRHPILPYSFLDQIKKCSSISELDQTLFKCLENPTIKKALSISNPEYWENLEKARLSGNLKGFRPSLLRYIDRMCVRTTQFQALSAVSFMEDSDGEDEISFRSYESIKSFNDSAIKSDSVVRLNPTFWSEGIYAFVWSFRLHKVNTLHLYDKKIFHAGVNVILALVSSLRKPLKLEKLVLELENKLKSSRTQIQNLIQSLVAEEVILEESRDVFCFDLNSNPSFLPEHEENSFALVLSNKRADRPAIDRELEEIKDIFQDLNAISYEKWKPLWIQDVKADFLRQFPDNDASFLEVIHKLPLGPREKKIDYELDSSLVKILYNLLDEAGGTFIPEIELSEKNIKKIKSLRKKLVNFKDSSLSYTAFVLRNDQSQFWVKMLMGAGANRHFGFYSLISEKAREEVITQWEEEKKLVAPAILVEVVNRSHSKVVDYTRRGSAADYFIDLLVMTDCPDEKVLPLSDLRLTIIEDKFVLYSKKLNKQIIPVASHKVMWAIAHPVEKFLLSIGHQGQVLSMAWAWEKIINRPYLPRLTYKGIVLSPRKWIISSSFLKEVIAGEDFYTVLQSQFKIDSNVMMLEGDKTTSLDFHSLSSKIILEKVIAQNDVVIFMEEFKGESYVDEFLITVSGKRPATALDHFVPPLKEYLPEPSQSCVSFHISLHHSWYNYFLSQVLPKIWEGIVGRFGVTHSFFIKYSTYGHEIRIRFFGERIHEISAIEAVLHRCVQQGLSHVVRDINLVPYRRSLSHYGDVRGNELYELLSFNDSKSSLAFHKLNFESSTADSILPNVEGMKLERETLWFLLSSVFYIESFVKLGMTYDEVDYVLRHRSEMWKTSGNIDEFSSIHSYYKKNRKILKSLLTNPRNRENTFLNKALTVLEQRSLMDETHLKELFERAKDEKCLIRLPHYLFRLIHMSKVRLSLDLNLEIEALLLDLLANLYKDLRLSAPAK